MAQINDKEQLRFRIVRDLICQYCSAYIEACEKNDDSDMDIIDSAHDMLLILEDALLDPDIDQNEALYYSSTPVETVETVEVDDEDDNMPNYGQEQVPDRFDVV